jgi:hypothetical protein
MIVDGPLPHPKERQGQFQQGGVFRAGSKKLAFTLKYRLQIRNYPSPRLPAVFALWLEQGNTTGVTPVNTTVHS